MAIEEEHLKIETDVDKVQDNVERINNRRTRGRGIGDGYQNG